MPEITSTDIAADSISFSHSTHKYTRDDEKKGSAIPMVSKIAGTSAQIMRLPLEIRQQIYSYLIPHNLTVDLHFNAMQCIKFIDLFQDIYRRHAMGVSIPIWQWEDHHLKSYCKEICSAYGTHSRYRSGCSVKKIDHYESNYSNSALLLCRETSSDILDNLYAENTFMFRLHDTEGVPNQNIANAARMRRVEVVIGHDAGPKGERFDEDFWSLLLPGLSSLKITITLAKTREVRSQAGLQTEMDRWLIWILTVFRQFANYLSTQTCVEIAIEDGRLGILELLKEYIPQAKVVIDYSQRLEGLHFQTKYPTVSRNSG